MNEVIQKLVDAAGVRVLNNVVGFATPLAAIPKDYKVESLENFLNEPTRIRQTISLISIDEFVEYVDKYHINNTTIFVTPNLQDLSKGTVLAKAIIDYHSPKNEGDGLRGNASWGDHIVLLKATPSPEYELLMQLDGQIINQSDFALKLRDIARFCTSHPAADILDVVRTMTLTSTGNFESIEDDFSGSVKLGYDVQVKANAGTQQRKLEVPRSITFNAPLLLGMEPVEIVAELLYRIPKNPQEKVQLGIRLPDRKWQELETVNAVAARLREATDLLTLVGSVS